MAARWKYKTGKVRGGYGEIDTTKKVIKIDKAKHRSKAYKRITPTKNGNESMINTITHEMAHKKFPSKNEQAIEKLGRAMASRMTPKQKNKLYSKFK